MRNRYPGRCCKCRETVETGKGVCWKWRGRWYVRHADCDPWQAAASESSADRAEAYQERLERERDDAEYARGQADYERWSFNRRMFGEDYAAAEEYAWELKDPDPYY